MVSQTQTRWKQFLDKLYGDGASKRRQLPPRKVLSANARACGFPEALERFQPDGRVDCRALLQLCKPLLDRLCPEPDAGWLSFFYDSIAAGLFTDPDRPTDSPAQAQAMGLYLALLEPLLAGEQEIGRAACRERVFILV